jgi:purine-binding chemotaxis protein CheW
MTENMSLDQWVVLRLDTQEYALAVNHVVEVLRMVAIQPLPEAPPGIAGVLNLRGKGTVVMDLRKRLGLPPREPDLHSQIVIIDVKDNCLGLIADEVTDILTLPRSALKPAEKLSGVSSFFAGLAYAGERLILVLDPDRLTTEFLASASPGEVHA